MLKGKSGSIYVSPIIFLLLLLFNFSFVNAAEKPDYAVLDQLLRQEVKDGKVNYKHIKAHPQTLLSFLEGLETVSREQYESWSRLEKMAFWINAYNAITIYGIIQHYPIQYGGLIARARFPQNSIRQIGGFWDKIFVKPLGEELSLNDIEHEILRKQFKDPRIHFVLVCAAVSCPELAPHAYFPEVLDHQLQEATLEFFRNPEKVRLDRQKGILYLSSILDWYKDDFTVETPLPGLKKKYGKMAGVIQFALEYLPEKDADFLKNNLPEVKFLKYDWSLNELP
ncbi:MAG: DUF547 domain-containing protein [Calditrichia bacterium]